MSLFLRTESEKADISFSVGWKNDVTITINTETCKS